MPRPDCGSTCCLMPTPTPSKRGCANIRAYRWSTTTARAPTPKPFAAPCHKRSRSPTAGTSAQPRRGRLERDHRAQRLLSAWLAGHGAKPAQRYAHRRTANTEPRPPAGSIASDICPKWRSRIAWLGTTYRTSAPAEPLAAVLSLRPDDKSTSRRPRFTPDPLQTGASDPLLHLAWSAQRSGVGCHL
jgi:hypothetical protein